ncbi:hypothetical protein PMAYCL1PPCAC_12822, partial [Pristionchus mayeri]
EMALVRVGILGNGHLGKFLHSELSSLSSEFVVVRVWNRSVAEGEDVLPLEKLDGDHLSDIDLVVEVAHPLLVKKFAPLILQHSDLFIGSPTCLADQELLDAVKKLAVEKNRKVLVPAGAFWGGNDIQKMADKGTLKALQVSMSKHPDSFKLESPLKEINEKAKLETEKETVLYEGPVRDLCSLAPNNVNTMAGASIAAHNLGFDGVTARLVADPKLRDWHIVGVVATGPDGFEVETIRKNPAKPGAVTGQLTYFSFLASIKEGRSKPVGGLHIC